MMTTARRQQRNQLISWILSSTVLSVRWSMTNGCGSNVFRDLGLSWLSLWFTSRACSTSRLKRLLLITKRALKDALSNRLKSISGKKSNRESEKRRQQQANSMRKKIGRSGSQLRILNLNRLMRNGSFAWILWARTGNSQLTKDVLFCLLSSNFNLTGNELKLQP